MESLQHGVILVSSYLFAALWQPPPADGAIRASTGKGETARMGGALKVGVHALTMIGSDERCKEFGESTQHVSHATILHQVVLHYG
jgi:hypothetical protein